MDYMHRKLFAKLLISWLARLFVKALFLPVRLARYVVWRIIVGIVIFLRGGKSGQNGPAPRPAFYASLTSASDLEAQLNLLNEHNVGPELPISAKERLLIMSGQSGGSPLFTSDLSVNEFLLTKEVGFEPLGLVMGSSVYRFTVSRGYNPIEPFEHAIEVKKLTRARYMARERAMSRMVAEARILKADGIIGVKLTIQDQAWETNMTEFMVIGTAVRATGERAYPVRQDEPFTSDLSGQDFWTLLKAGYFPLGMVMGNAVYLTSSYAGFWTNYETRFSEALAKAKDKALERLRAEAAVHQAEGIVGSRVYVHHLTHWEEEWKEKAISTIQFYEVRMFEYFSIGTAISSIGTNRHITKPIMINRTNS